MAGSASERSAFQQHVLDFDIDRYLNPICPRQRFYLLPNFISHWFGYRAPGSTPQRKLSNLGIWTSAFVGGFVGIAIIMNVYAHLPLLGHYQAPAVIASFGAAAILEYNTIESPLSQPRNLVMGHFLSAVIGVAITKGFERLGPERFDELRWLAGSLSVGLASFVMGATKTVHPPAGATALLASTSADITVLGWWLLPLVLLATALMGTSALIVNNLTRRWPLYWWTAADLSRPKDNPEVKHVKDVEKQPRAEAPSIGSVSGSSSLTKGAGRHIENDETAPTSDVITDGRYDGETQIPKEYAILITANEVILPDWWEPDDWEKQVLEILKDKMSRKERTS